METKATSRADVTVIGGGITGIVAALRLARSGAHVILADSSLPGAEGKLGGFARFSGAKFSLPPAGLGLVPVAGSRERLTAVIEEVLALLGMSAPQTALSIDAQLSNHRSATLRRYESIVLTPSQIEELLGRLERKLRAARVQVLYGSAKRLRKNGDRWETTLELTSDGGPPNKECVTSDAVFFAAGRLAEDVMQEAGAEPTEGKGLDVGLRLEFEDLAALRGLRTLGPDAKILEGACRTFCLNSPGKIYYYPCGSLQLPGGVVADPSVLGGNVGVLMRVCDKQSRLAEIMDAATPRSTELFAVGTQIRRGAGLPLPDLVDKIFGHEAARTLSDFCQMLHERGLVDLSTSHRIHMPLLDWHWPTWAKPSSHRTSLDNIFALGDSAGHARGLLQGALSGWLAAEEFLC